MARIWRLCGEFFLILLFSILFTGLIYAGADSPPGEQFLGEQYPEDFYQTPADTVQQITDYSYEINSIKDNINLQSKEIKELKENISSLKNKLDEYANAKPSPSSDQYYIPLIISVILVVFFSVIIFVRFGGKEKKGANQPHSVNYPLQMPTYQTPNPLTLNLDAKRVDSLRNYISYNARRGYNPHVLKQGLLKQGHRRNEVELAFSRAGFR